MMRSIVVLVAGGLLSLCVLPAQAQDAILEQTYGNGVHAYFAGDYLKAHQCLTSAIDGGSRDPRCYYFRGLAYLNLGRPQDAESDFQQGAKLETGDLNRIYNVAKSLERVQGPARLDLEQYRAAARMAALEQAERLRKQRYEELNREERRTLESQAGPPAARGSGEAVPLPESRLPDNPFATPAAPGGEKPAEGAPKVVQPPPGAETPAEPKKAGEEAQPANPFGGGEGGAAKPGGAAAKKPAAKKAAAEKAGDESADPFGGAPEKAAAPAKKAVKKAAEKAAKNADAEKADADEPKPEKPEKPGAKKGADSADPFN